MFPHDNAEKPECPSAVVPNAHDGELQKNDYAEAIAKVARSVKESADSLEDSLPELAHLIRTSADTVEKASNAVRDQDFRVLADTVGDFASRQPIAFIGCGLLAGVLLGRLFPSYKAE